MQKPFVTDLNDLADVARMSEHVKGGPSFANTSNTVVLGGSATTCIRSSVTAITGLSDCRDKTNICAIPVGLEFVRALRPVKFEWNHRDVPGGKRGLEEPGFIAQDLIKVIDQFDAGWMNLVNTENPDRYEAAQTRILPVAVKAIQELAVDNDQMRQEIDEIRARIEILESRVQ
jgi:hypothetical protein